ncbi:ParB/RepB/Spo0J family partition protein [Paraburkholderia fungorum]|uniref:ParB/RepB/Spo0J family partition protein n=1 Tax=Paraburkholderia fungorum TaxID=134537 RepID=UPI00160AE432|nr:ParB/RepB/Spo0J family partition protein [Paraburkholderia fungorum]MBB5547401.1 ParB/RepB/Spo0J family partition protein [Paraburkholderia fungorum]
MSKNPLMAKMRSSLQKDGQSPQPESVSAVEAPLAMRNRFRLAEELDVPPATQAPAAKGPAALALAPLPEDTEWSAEYRRWCLENSYQPGSTIEVSLSQVKESVFNPRHFYLARRLEDLTASIAEGGQQQPIHVVPDYDNPGEFFVHDGGRRVRSMRGLKYAKARAMVVDVPIGIQSYKLGYELNTRRENQTPFDNAVKWTYLLENKHFASQKELAETLGQDESIVSQTLTIGKLPEEVMFEMISSQERFPVRVAYEVSKFHQDNGGDMEKTLDLVERIVRLDMKQRQVIEFRSRFNATRRGADASDATRSPRQRSVPVAPVPPVAPAGRQTQPQGEQGPGLADPQVHERTNEEYRSADGKIHAVLVERDGGLVLDVHAETDAELSTIAQSLRHLLTNIVR